MCEKDENGRHVDIYPLIVDKIFSQKANSSTAYRGNYLLLYGSGRPRWFVPEDPSIGYRVLSQWKPFGRTSGVKWILLLLLYVCRLLRYMPGVVSKDVSSVGEILGGDRGCVPVLYVGTPSSARKLVAILVNVAGREIDSVVKIAIGDRARDAIRNEVEVLGRLHAAGMKNIPIVLGYDSSAVTCRQTVIEGRPSHRRFGARHKEWLLSLPREGLTSLNKVYRGMLSQAEYTPTIPIRIREIISNYLVRDNILSLPKIWVHGDFVPWNLKYDECNKIVAVDWEDAEIGLPLHDICHFFLMQAYLFSNKNVSKAIERMRCNGYVIEYLEELGIARSHIDSLIICYLVNTILRRSPETNDGFRLFLERALCEVCSP